jgi:hypothetical protein
LGFLPLETSSRMQSIQPLGFLALLPFTHLHSTRSFPLPFMSPEILLTSGFESFCFELRSSLLSSRALLPAHDRLPVSAVTPPLGPPPFRVSPPGS